MAAALLGGSHFVYCVGRRLGRRPLGCLLWGYLGCRPFGRQPFCTLNAQFGTLNASFKFSEYCEIKCFGGLHVYFISSVRKVSSASLLILLQLVIQLKIA